jgi:hypothetical protein
LCFNSANGVSFTQDEATTRRMIDKRLQLIQGSGSAAICTANLAIFGADATHLRGLVLQ